MIFSWCEIIKRLKLSSLFLLRIEFKTQIRSKSNGNFFYYQNQFCTINFVFRHTKVASRC